VSSGIQREATHFYTYDSPIVEHPWRVMLARHTALRHAATLAQRAFLAGYVAHLTMDELWSLHMVRPHFVERAWESQKHRFIMLHIILIHMDERDYGLLEPWQRPTLENALPNSWLPFINDADLSGWRDFIGQQLPPHGESRTLDVFGERIGMTAGALRAILDEPQQMQAGLWAYIAPSLLADVEATMYAGARADLLTYLNDV
jgi:hypothetical protein